MIGVSESTIEKELSEKGSFAIVPKGESMLPMIRGGREVVVITKPSGKIRKYDVVLFKDEAGRYVLHRVIKITPDTLVTRGDNTYFKEYVRETSVIGVLSSYNKNGKTHSTKSFFYKIYTKRRVLSYPLRLAFIKARCALIKIYKTIFKKREK